MKEGLVCKVCGDPLPRYGLDRCTDDLCSYACDRYLEGASVVFGFIGMATGITRLLEHIETEKAFACWEREKEATALGEEYQCTCPPTWLHDEPHS